MELPVTLRAKQPAPPPPTKPSKRPPPRVKPEPDLGPTSGGEIKPSPYAK